MLWKIAQAFLNTLYALFGGPERIAFQHTHTRAERALFLPWLKAGEALMRRLLLIEAAAYPKPNTPPRLWPKRRRVKKLVGFDADAPETWRVSLRCLHNTLPGRSEAKSRGPFQRVTEMSESCAAMDPGSARATHACPGSVGHFAQPTKFYSAWPLAERYESIIRVFNNPAPFAKALEMLGFNPTWEAVGAQIAIGLVAIAGTLGLMMFGTRQHPSAR